MEEKNFVCKMSFYCILEFVSKGEQGEASVRASRNKKIVSIQT